MLSPQVKAERIASNSCFVCGKQGHFSRNCPQNSQVKSDKKGKPPGLTSFHVGFSSSVPSNAPGTEELRALAESTETTAGLNLFSLQFADEEDSPSEGAAKPLGTSFRALWVTSRE